MTDKDKKIEDMSFEEALAALEQVVSSLDGGQVPLEESITLYQRGEALRDHCEKRLKDAEMKVSQITTNKDGEPDGEIPF